ncbi:MAG TPA: PAS domain-containing protein, partial [Gemmatales bacterium]|nr:PAS domain-containing protein [Gemmatales bacterium]
MLGESFFEAFSPEFQSLAANFGKQLQANKLGPYCSNTFTTKEGKKLYLQWNNTIIHNSEGKSIGMFSLGEDITQKQIALEALRESEEQNRRITEGIPLALYRSTPDGRILYGNRVLAELMNIQDPKQLESINLQTTDTGPTYNRDEFNAELEKNGEIIGLEYQWKRPNQEPRWVRENARAIRDASGKVQ